MAFNKRDGVFAHHCNFYQRELLLGIDTGLSATRLNGVVYTLSSGCWCLLLKARRLYIGSVNYFDDVMAGDKDKFLGVRMNAYISKPVDMATLKETIERVMSKRGDAE